MAWARYDDELAYNKKIARLRTKGQAGIAAIGLHLLCNTWARHEGTGGLIEAHIPGQLVGDNRLGKKLADLLEWAEMFDLADAGWSLRNFDEFSDPKDDGRPASEKKRDRRAVAQANGSKGGKAKAANTASKATDLLEGSLEQISTPVPDPVPVVSTQVQTSLQPVPDDPLVVRMKAIAVRYAEVIWQTADQKRIGSPAGFKNDAYKKALEMPKCAQYARDYTEECPVDILANALAGENGSLRYVESYRREKAS